MTSPAPRTHPRAIALAAPVLASALALLAGGCSGSASVSTTPTVSQSDLEKEVSAQLAEQVGQTPDSVDCPGDLEGTEGTTERCTLTADGTNFGLTVTVTSVAGTDVKFDIQVDQQPQS